MIITEKNAEGKLKLVMDICPDLKITITRDSSIDGRMDLGDGYRFKLTRGDRSFSTRYNDSVRNSGKDPNVAGALECVISDMYAYRNTLNYRDFCQEFGYEEDAYRGIRAYNACKRTSEQLGKMFTDNELESIGNVMNLYGQELDDALEARVKKETREEKGKKKLVDLSISKEFLVKGNDVGR